MTRGAADAVGLFIQRAVAPSHRVAAQHIAPSQGRDGVTFRSGSSTAPGAAPALSSRQAVSCLLDCNLELIAPEEYRFHPNHLIWRLNFRSPPSSK